MVDPIPGEAVQQNSGGSVLVDVASHRMEEQQLVGGIPEE